MSFLDDIAAARIASLAELDSEVIDADGVRFAKADNTGAGALGYGTDLAWNFETRDIYDDWRLTDPLSVESVIQSIERFLLTPRGLLINDAGWMAALDEDQSWGENILNALSIGTKGIELTAKLDLAGAAIVDHDDRIRDCTLSVSPSDVGLDSMLLILQGHIADSNLEFSKTYLLDGTNLSEIFK